MTETTQAQAATDWQERYAQRMMRTFAPPLATLVRGEGAWVWDAQGRRYLDFLAGIAVNALGHAHPALVQAAARQAATLVHVSNYFSTPWQIELAERLVELAGLGGSGRVFFANSGTEANEAAFKLARLNRGDGSRTRLLALESSFHGRTMGAMALTGKPGMRAPFEPMPAGVEHLPLSIEALEAAMDERVAALIVEPILGETGVIPLPEGYLRRARELTQRHGALLIVDEIQTGIGRTGAWFAFQHEGIVPDAITVAKALGGGVPIGALLTTGWASELFGAGQHGSTFGGNPFATSVALAVVDEIAASGLLANASRRGAQIREMVLGLGSPLVAELRGRGLLLGVGLAEPVAARVAAAALEQGLIVNATNERSIRLAPPLIVGDAELAAFGERFAAALRAVEGELQEAGR